MNHCCTKEGYSRKERYCWARQRQLGLSNSHVPGAWSKKTSRLRILSGLFRGDQHKQGAINAFAIGNYAGNQNRKYRATLFQLALPGQKISH